MSYKSCYQIEHSGLSKGGVRGSKCLQSKFLEQLTLNQFKCNLSTGLDSDFNFEFNGAYSRIFQLQICMLFWFIYFLKFVFNTRRVFLPFDANVNYMNKFKISSLTREIKLRTKCVENRKIRVFYLSTSSIGILCRYNLVSNRKS